MSNPYIKGFRRLHDVVIGFRPIYSLILGRDIKAALLLSQLLYWDNKMEGHEFYKTDKDLQKELTLSLRELAAAKQTLLDHGLIQITRRGVPAKSYYLVDTEKVFLAVSTFEENQLSGEENSSYNKSAQLENSSYNKSAQLDITKPHLQLCGNVITTTEDYAVDKTEEEGEEAETGEQHVAKSLLYMIETWDAMAAQTGLEPILREGSTIIPKIYNLLLKFWNEYDLGKWSQLMKALDSSPFLGKENSRGWHAHVEWVLQPKNLSAILGGKYQKFSPSCDHEQLSVPSPQLNFAVPPPFLQGITSAGENWDSPVVFWCGINGHWHDVANHIWEFDENTHTWHKSDKIHNLSCPQPSTRNSSHGLSN